VTSVEAPWWSRMGNSGSSWPAPITPPARSRGHGRPVSNVLRRGVTVRSLSGERVKEGPFIAAATILAAPTPFGISPFQRSVLSVDSHTWWRSKERTGFPYAVPKRSAVIGVRHKSHPKNPPVLPSHSTLNFDDPLGGRTSPPGRSVFANPRGKPYNNP